MEDNQMKMREALEGLARAVRAFMATKGANFYPDVAIALEAANAALLVPERNCDRFATWEAALSAFREETGNSKPLELWLGCEIQLLAIWLLAPAAERKGEGDGR